MLTEGLPTLEEVYPGTMYRINLAKEIMRQIPGTALGGSLGLFMQDISVGRSLEAVDIDLVIPRGLELDEIKDLYRFVEVVEGSSPETMHYVMVHEDSMGDKIKIDMQVQPGVPTHTIDGLTTVDYMHTIGWKTYYAIQGNEKHAGDLMYIFFKSREKPKKIEL